MKKILIVIAVAVIGAFAWWTISPLFIDTVVEDELDPEIAALLEETNNSAPLSPIETEVPVSDEAEVVTTTPAEEAVTSSIVDETSTPAPTAELTSSVSGPFPIIDTPGHAATGDIRVIQTPEETIVRYENYDGTNGPDLKVYLTNDLAANEFVNLGVAKGNQGNINYTVPADVDVDEYKYVVTWCEAFGVLFDYAEIN